MKMQGDGWMGRREGRGSDRLCVAPNICVILREYNIHLYGTFGSARVVGELFWPASSNIII